MQYFVEGLANHTGYPVSKLVGKKIWRVYDTLTCQVNLLLWPQRDSHTVNTKLLMCNLQLCSYTNASVTDANSSCRAAKAMRKDPFPSTHLHRPEERGWGAAAWVNYSHTYSKTWIGQHIEMIIKALWDGWISGQVEYAHSHLHSCKMSICYLQTAAKNSRDNRNQGNTAI